MLEAEEAELAPVLVPVADVDTDAEPEDEIPVDAGATELDEAELVAEPAEVDAGAEPVPEETATDEESVACAKAAWAKMSAEMIPVAFIFTWIIRMTLGWKGK